MVFLSGMSIMAVELSASRLLAPYFGTSLFVWTNLIGIVMIALAIGYWQGGKLADKHPKQAWLYTLMLVASCYLALLPAISNPVMQLAVRGVTEQSVSIFYSSLLATITLISLPLVLLGMVSPFAIRIVTKELKAVGTTAGNIYALSTIGSIIGTFLPALVMIPFLGTTKTIFLFASLLAIFSVIGLWMQHKQKALFSIVLIVVAGLLISNTIKPVEGLLHEEESVYNYIQVIEKGEYRLLQLNEGQATHSVYHPEQVLVGGVWDYFSLLPSLRPKAEDAAIIGLAAGTISRSYASLFPEIKVTGIELDPDIIEVGEKYFDLDQPSLSIRVFDGRTFLAISEKEYGLIMIDAYQQPYIPFHLTTKEFFELVKKRLKTEGIVAMNVGAVSEDSEVLLMIQNTLASVFENVVSITAEGQFNVILLASDGLLKFPEEVEQQELQKILDTAKKQVVPVQFNPDQLVLTDDKAPVELFTDKMIWEYAQK
jgi:spermidine synthase